MLSTHIDADTAKSAMTLLGAVLVFISTASAIVNNRLDKARNAAAKERVVSTAFGCVLVILQAIGCVMLFTIGAVLVFVEFVCFVGHTFIHKLFAAARAITTNGDTSFDYVLVVSYVYHGHLLSFPMTPFSFTNCSATKRVLLVIDFVGVLKPSRSQGRLFNTTVVRSNIAAEEKIRLRLVPLGRYCRMNGRCVFSLVPRSQAWCGVAK